MLIDFGNPYGRVYVNFPVKNLVGLSSVVGFFSYGGSYYVVKLLRTKQFDESSFGRKFHEPLLRQLLKHLPFKNNPLTPSTDMFDMFVYYINQCHEYLFSVNRDEARIAILDTFDFVRTKPDQIEYILDLAFLGKETINYFPRESKALRIEISCEESINTLAIVQEDITHGSYQFKSYVTSLVQKSEACQIYDASFLILSGLAIQMSEIEGLGIDLFPHFDSMLPLAVKFPNVLIRPKDHSLVYVDTSGLFPSDGNSVERLGNRMLYSKTGILKTLANKLFKSVVNKT